MSFSLSNGGITGNTVRVNVNGISNLSYTYDAGDGIHAGGGSSSFFNITYDEPGSYTVRVDAVGEGYATLLVTISQQTSYPDDPLQTTSGEYSPAVIAIAYRLSEIAQSNAIIAANLTTLASNSSAAVSQLAAILAQIKNLTVSVEHLDEYATDINKGIVNVGGLHPFNRAMTVTALKSAGTLQTIVNEMNHPTPIPGF